MVYTLVSASLFGKVNPFVIENAQKLSLPTLVIPLPKAQIVDSNSTFKLLLEAKESLYIYRDLNKTSKKSNQFKKLLIAYSLDGTLFKKEYLTEDYFPYDYFKNPYNKPLAIEILNSDPSDTNIQYFTTYNGSVLQNYPSHSLYLDAPKTRLFSVVTQISHPYYRFSGKQELFVNAKEPQTLLLKVRKVLSPLDRLSPSRIRLKITLNHKQSKFESLESVATRSYIEDSNHTIVSQEATHFIALEKGENNITIDSSEEILCTASLYNNNVSNPINDINLSYDFYNTQTQINQSLWKNTNQNDGLKRKHAIENQSTLLPDTKEQIGLQISAKKSTFMKPLFPTVVPQNTLVKEGYYTIGGVTFDSRQKRTPLHNRDYDFGLLSGYKEGKFVEVPLDKQQNSKKIYTQEIDKLYFKTREYKLDKPLRNQIKTALKKIESYHHIYLYGHTDTTGNQSMNHALSLKRCKEVQSYMVALGIPKEHISIDFYGEKKQAIKTKDETIEASNRRVDIQISQEVPIINHLEYQFATPLQNDREIEITLLCQHPQEIFIDTNTQPRQRLYYTPQNHFEPFKFNLWDLSSLKQENNLLTRLSLLNNRASSLPVYHQTGTLSLKLKKGTSFVRISRSKTMEPCFVAVSMREKSIYKDTPYALTHNYSNTYQKFASSIGGKAPSALSAWFEHTTPLRLWMEAQLAQIKKGLNPTEIPDAKTVAYSKVLMEHHSRFTAIQIAKHALMLSPLQTIQKKAYDFLLFHAKNDKEKLFWHTLYFIKTASPKTLQEIANLLEKEGKIKLAQDAFLLLPKREKYRKKVSKLALYNNDIALYEALNLSHKRPTVHSYLEKKERQKANATKNIQVVESMGADTLYAKNRDVSFEYHKATLAQPLKLKIEGPLVLNLDMRLSSPIKSYKWIKIKDEKNNKTYLYPLVPSIASTSLENISRNSFIGTSNSVEIFLDKGEHLLSIDGYEAPLLIGFKGYFPDAKSVKPIDKQLITTDFNQEEFLSHTQDKESIAYVSSLLHLYQYGTLNQRYHAKVEAFLLSQKTDNPILKKMLLPLTQYSNFTPYLSLTTPLGWYEQKVTPWHPLSTLQKDRTPLLTNIKGHHLILTDANYRVFHIDAGQTMQFTFEQPRAKYLPYAPLVFAISIDNAPEKRIQLTSKVPTVERFFKATNKPKSIRVRMIEPKSTHYLGIKIAENGVPIEGNTTQRYFIVSKKEPIVLHEKGPKLLRIEERLPNQPSILRYVYLNKNKIYHYKLRPSLAQESLVRIASFDYDSLNIPSEPFTPPSFVPSRSLTNHPYEIASLIKPPLQKASVQMVSLEPTWTLYAGLRNVNLAQEDVTTTNIKKVAQLGALYRLRLNEEQYLKEEFFIRQYDNPLYAFKNRFYSKLPWSDFWAILDTNGYFQYANAQWFSNIELSGTLLVREDLSQQWWHNYGVNVFQHFLNYGEIDNATIDPLVYSDYKRFHRYGVGASYNLFYQPYTDTQASIKTNVRSNEALFTLDKAISRFTLNHHAEPFDIALRYTMSHYFTNAQRQNSITYNTFGAGVNANLFFGTNRLEVEAGISHTPQKSNTNFNMTLLWHFSHQKEKYHFMPPEKLFNSLKVLLNQEQRE